MKNENIHEKFSDSEVRDFLSKQLGHSYAGEVAHLKEQIRQLEERLSIAKRSEAARTLIVEKGWSEHDVSDLITDYNRDTYFPFVGSKEELNLTFKYK